MCNIYKHILVIICCILCTSVSFSQSHYTLQNKQTEFIITYNNVPDSVQSCVQFVADELKKYIYTPIPIRMSVTWSQLGANVLAYAKPSEMVYNISGLPYADVLYPIALAEKLVSKNLNFSKSDIEVVINSTSSWQANYMSALDINKYDLATILLHECIHGFGMSGNFMKQNSIPTLAGLPTIFDRFVNYDFTHSIADLYTQSKISNDSLAILLVSDSVYWAGSYSNAFVGYMPELYAPKQFDFGSSIYHFDEQLYPKGDSNSLMTYILTKGERIHNPGIAVLGILADIGWTDYFVSHNSILNSTNILFAPEFTLSCIDSLFIQGSQTVLYSYDGGKNFMDLPMNYDALQESYSGQLSAFPFEHTCTYAYRIVTKNNDTLYYPSDYPTHVFEYSVSVDTQSPEIQHAQLSVITLGESSIEFVATVLDNFSIDSVYVEYIIGRNEFAQILTMGKKRMNSGDFGLFSVELDVQNIQLQENDMLAYTIHAVDSHSNSSSIVPIGNYVFAVFEPKQTPLHFFITDFDHDSIASYLYLDKFSITQPSGFTNKALHTEHPYKASGKDLTYLHYIAELKNPIIIAENPAYIEFDEIVLVEPSLTNVLFGEYGFWDYVIVEANKNKKTDEWYALGKVGYDSRSQSVWLSTFYQSLDNEKNSIAIPTESLYRKRIINLLENKYFRTGDTVSIRFRLQSDFIVTGWGWAIDNLKIQERISLQDNSPLREAYALYPNPCKQFVHVSNYVHISSITLYSMLGIPMDVRFEDGVIDVASIPSGNYIVSIVDTEGKVWRQLLLKK